jgi:hypothetical protein
MSDIRYSVEHHRSKEEACACLFQAVGQAQGQFGALLHRVDWSAERDSVRLAGPGFEIDARVDERHVHISGRVPLFGRLLAAPLLQGLKQMTERALEDRSRK